MHDDLCQATAESQHGHQKLHCWRAPHSDDRHLDRDFAVWWSPAAIAVPAKPKRHPFAPWRRPEGGVPVPAAAMVPA